MRCIVTRHENREHPSGDEDLIQKISADSQRKIRLKQTGADKPWFGMGLMGLVGWSITVPCLLGLVAGVWIDRRWPSPVSWTLMLLAGGIGLGCLNVWYWLGRQADEIDSESGASKPGKHKRKGRP
ncbi:MAG: AtpZ/AtpI family protein [Eubacteriales bacterium]|nr:AtpZ/AtpI family protein [Eubacteriales bacterium]